MKKIVFLTLLVALFCVGCVPPVSSTVFTAGIVMSSTETTPAQTTATTMTPMTTTQAATATTTMRVTQAVGFTTPTTPVFSINDLGTSQDNPFVPCALPHICIDNANQMIITFNYVGWYHDYVSGTNCMLYVPLDSQKYPMINLSIYYLPDQYDENSSTDKITSLMDTFFRKRLKPGFDQTIDSMKQQPEVQTVGSNEGSGRLYTVTGNFKGREVQAQAVIIASHGGYAIFMTNAPKEFAEQMHDILLDTAQGYSYLG